MTQFVCRSGDPAAQPLVETLPYQSQSANQEREKPKSSNDNQNISELCDASQPIMNEENTATIVARDIRDGMPDEESRAEIAQGPSSQVSHDSNDHVTSPSQTNVIESSHKEQGNIQSENNEQDTENKKRDEKHEEETMEKVDSEKPIIADE